MQDKLVHTVKEHYISQETWDDIKHERDHAKFSKLFSQTLWSDYEMRNRSFEPSRCQGEKRYIDRSPVKVIEKNRYKILKGIFNNVLFVTSTFKFICLINVYLYFRVL